MAKTGTYLNGKELLECELQNLGEFEKAAAITETTKRICDDKTIPKKLKGLLSCVNALLVK